MGVNPNELWNQLQHLPLQTATPILDSQVQIPQDSQPV